MEPGESIRKSFGSRLRSLREAAGYSADSLAKALGVHRNTVFGLERGEHWIGADLLEKICKVLRVTADQLFLDKEAGIPEPSVDRALAVLIRELGFKSGELRRSGPSPLPPELLTWFGSLTAADEAQITQLRSVMEADMEARELLRKRGDNRSDREKA